MKHKSFTYKDVKICLVLLLTLLTYEIILIPKVQAYFNKTEDFYDPSDVKSIKVLSSVNTSDNGQSITVPSTVKLQTFTEGERPPKDYICDPKFKWNCELAKHIAFCESSFNTKAKNPHGTASGLYQFTASTWKWVRGLMGRSKDLDLRFDYRESVDTAYKLFTLYGFDSTASWHESSKCWK